MKVLHLTLKKKWFDMILSGGKRQEYRTIKPYWIKRLEGKEFDAVKFRNGYAADAPSFTIELKEVYRGFGRVEWGAPEPIQRLFVLCLGEIIEVAA